MCFQIYDTDNSGYISREELIQLLAVTSEGPAEESPRPVNLTPLSHGGAGSPASHSDSPASAASASATTRRHGIVHAHTEEQVCVLIALRPPFIAYCASYFAGR